MKSAGGLRSCFEHTGWSKHLTNLLVPNSIFLDFGHQNLEDWTNAAVQEGFKLVKLGLAQGP
jgi:hypothetical protein